MVSHICNLKILVMLLPRHCVAKPRPTKVSTTEDAPVLLDGASEFDILCPVSKLTGNRTNPLDLLKMALPDKDYRFLNALLQEVPSLASDPKMSDEDRIQTLTYRLCSGTPAENEQVMHDLMKVADVLFPKEVKQAEDTIKFEASDAGVETPASE